MINKIELDYVAWYAMGILFFLIDFCVDFGFAFLVFFVVCFAFSFLS